MRATLNGIEIAYTDEGEGPPLFFVHGFPLCRRTWSKQVAAFKSSHRVLAPDLRGLGETQATPGPISMRRFAEDLFALMQHLKLGPVTLVGHSMGGYIALAFAGSLSPGPPGAGAGGHEVRSGCSGGGRRPSGPGRSGSDGGFSDRGGCHGAQDALRQQPGCRHGCGGPWLHAPVQARGRHRRPARDG
ncbi:MAG: alpha/beta hydrolase [Holophagaceae bacterium]|uniref:Alpha/beta hydrolase n=1 Tax=Candidatus Geothrix skivensis TaxID=2954439 RepID=A0A9D7SJG8_9BACT|nr:alpha/beta hydrolase [Candidatus Geothrix skivensis]